MTVKVKFDELTEGLLIQKGEVTFKVVSIMPDVNKAMIENVADSEDQKTLSKTTLQRWYTVSESQEEVKPEAPKKEVAKKAAPKPAKPATPKKAAPKPAPKPKEAPKPAPKPVAKKEVATEVDTEVKAQSSKPEKKKQVGEAKLKATQLRNDFLKAIKNETSLQGHSMKETSTYIALRGTQNFAEISSARGGKLKVSVRSKALDAEDLELVTVVAPSYHWPIDASYIVSSPDDFQQAIELVVKSYAISK